MSGRTDWKALLPRAAEIVHSYDTGVTLRQLFYRLVANQSLPNTTSAYKSLSKYTAHTDIWCQAAVTITSSWLTVGGSVATARTTRSAATAASTACASDSTAGIRWS